MAHVLCTLAMAWVLWAQVEVIQEGRRILVEPLPEAGSYPFAAVADHATCEAQAQQWRAAPSLFGLMPVQSFTATGERDGYLHVTVRYQCLPQGERPADTPADTTKK